MNRFAGTVPGFVKMDDKPLAGRSIQEIQGFVQLVGEVPGKGVLVG